MPCYFRQLKDIFDGAGITVTASNRKQVDQAIHKIVGTNYKDCPDTWKRLKQDIMPDEQKRQDFIAKLKSAIG